MPFFRMPSFGFFGKIFCKEHGLLCLAGALYTLAFPPFFMWPLALATLVWLFIQIDAAPSTKQAAKRAFIFGFGHYLTSLYWISHSLLVEPERYGWMVPFALTLIPAAVAAYFALTALLYRLSLRLFTHATTLLRYALFALVFVAIEYLRGHALSGFPWNLAGMVLLVAPALSQIASVVGSYGLSLLLLLLAGLALPTLSLRIRAYYAALIFVLLFGLHSLIPATLESTKQTQLHIIQPNIPQTLKWDDDYIFNAFLKHLELSKKHEGAEMIIWPEAAIPFVLEEDEIATNMIAGILEENQYVITGTLRIDRIKKQLFNSLIVLDRKGQAIAAYHKHHLVPFGEYVPLRNLFPFINKITPGSMDFSASDGPKTLRYSGTQPAIAPLICYEAIFPHQVHQNQDRARLLVNITNDAWFGQSIGPHQHLHHARMRAIEEGLPLARAANTGISALIDARGRILARLRLNETDSINAPLPDQAAQPLYARYGNLMLALMLALLAGGILLFRLTLAATKHGKNASEKEYGDTL